MAEKTKPDSLERSRVDPPAKADPKPLTDIEAIRRIERTLAQVPEPDRARVLFFIQDKFMPLRTFTMGGRIADADKPALNDALARMKDQKYQVLGPQRQ